MSTPPETEEDYAELPVDGGTVHLLEMLTSTAMHSPGGNSGVVEAQEKAGGAKDHKEKSKSGQLLSLEEDNRLDDFVGHSDVIIAADCFLGSTVDACLSQNCLKVSSEESLRDVPLESNAEENEEVKGGLADSFLNGMLGGEEEIKQEVMDDESSYPHKRLMPKFQLRIQPKSKAAAFRTTDDLDQDEPSGKRGRGRVNRILKKKATAHPNNLPAAPKKKRGPYGPRKKKSVRAGYAVDLRKQRKGSSNSDEGENFLTIDESRSKRRPRKTVKVTRAEIYHLEKLRRDRVATSVEVLRHIVPGLTDRTDRATVTLLTAQYILFMKKKISPPFDLEFMTVQDTNLKPPQLE